MIEYQSGIDMYQIAKLHGVHRTTVSNCLRRHDAVVRRRGLSKEQVEEAVQLYEAGWSLARIGERHGFAHTVVRKALLDRNVAMRPRQGWTY